MGNRCLTNFGEMLHFSKDWPDGTTERRIYISLSRFPAFLYTLALPILVFVISVYLLDFEPEISTLLTSMWWCFFNL